MIVSPLTTEEIDRLAAVLGDELHARLRMTLRGANSAGYGAGSPGRAAPPEAVDRSVAALIDHTLLKPEATREEVLALCQEARDYGFASACVNSCWVPLAAERLAGTAVRVCSVVGFPLGAMGTQAKQAEAESALRDGAQEIDMVINVGALRSGDQETVHADILSVTDAAHAAGALVKVILETALLDDGQKVLACAIAQRAGADFVKTSTGFAKSGATVEDVALLRKTVGARTGVKASGGIRTLDDLRRMVAAGATRIGASASVAIVSATAR